MGGEITIFASPNSESQGFATVCIYDMSPEATFYIHLGWQILIRYSVRGSKISISQVHYHAEVIISIWNVGCFLTGGT
jgi:hypothetical protein